MTTVVSLELTFDDEADALIRAEWDALHRADLPSQAQHTGASNRPHLTVLVRSSLGAIDGHGLESAFPLSLTLGAPLLFGTRRTRVLARSVVPSRALLELHAAVHAEAGDHDEMDHTAPGAWMPHVTLARRVPLERVAEALAVVSDVGGGELTVQATSLRRWDAAERTVTHVAGRGTLEPC